MEKIITAGLVVVMFLFMGCGAGRAPSPALEGTGKVQVKEEARVSAKEAWEEEWEKTLQAARKEGKVIVYSTTGGEMRDVVGRAFKERYGIGADFLVAKGSQIAEKVATERRAGIYIPDVYLGGAQTAMTYLKSQEYFAPLEPALLMPEVKDSHNWYGREFPWLDRDRLIVGFINQANIPLVINTNLVKPEEITSYKDLLKARWKGKLLMNDVTMEGAGSNWFSAAHLITGLEFMRELARQEPVIITDYRLQMEWLARGKYPILVAPHTGMLAEFIRAEAPLRGITPVEGSYRSSSSGNLALFNRASHPDAAKIFINWLLSKEGQKVYGRVMGFPSARLDVPTEGMNPLKIVDPNLKYINANSEEMLLKFSEYLVLAKEIFGPLKK